MKSILVTGSKGFIGWHLCRTIELINEDIELIETLINDKIDDYYINSQIIHIFPITFSISITLLLATYLLIR